jgi:hypothetical protein
MEKTRGITLELCFVFLLFAAGVAISVISWGYGFGSLAQPGPGLYPFFVGAFIAVFASVILVLAWKSGSGKPTFEGDGARTLALMAFTFCFWVVAMPVLGYVLVTLAATCAFCKIMRLEGWVKPLALSAGTALFIYVLFDHWHYIDLPRGILG